MMHRDALAGDVRPAVTEERAGFEAQSDPVLETGSTAP